MQIGLTNCLMFRSSFNRPNLSYEVRSGSYKKDAKVKEIAEFIAQKHSINLGNRRNAKCGIIYCTSKKRTEEVAEKLDSELGKILGRVDAPRVRYYHADLLPEERERIQQSWTDGHLPIVVATVAFGMGINKPDVRFVIHYNMPKSLEGYLQESGRAGRDGEAADCVLYYNWSDVQGHKSLLQDPDQRQEALDRGATSQQYDIQQDHSIESLHAVAAFCQEPLRCRREMMLEHFDEKFERSQCNKTCDNCQKLGGLEVKMVDRTEAAKTVIQVVRHLAKKQEATRRNETSLTKIAAVFNGASSQDKHDTSIFGAGKVHRLSKKEVDRLIRTMITKVSSCCHTLNGVQYHWLFSRALNYSLITY